MFFKRSEPSKGVAPFGEIQETRLIPNGDNGLMVSELVGQTELPDPELFKLQAQIDAGVPLKRVDTKILRGGLYEDAENLFGNGVDDSSSSDSSQEMKNEI